MRPLMTKAAAAIALAASAPARADWAVNLPQGVTPISQDVYSLHMFIFWVCVVIGVIVFGAIFWSIIHHRKSKGRVAAQWHESTTIEIMWTVVPFIILVVMAVPSAAMLVRMEDSSNADLVVRVTGYQWMWHYEYVDKDVEFYSKLATPRSAVLNQEEKGDDYLLAVDNRLVLPAGRKVRFEHTAGDVIHSWWVPTLSVKKDAIPGYINTNWAQIEEPGVYRGKCAELCGRGHGFMPVVVEAVPAEEFDAWLERKQEEQAQASADGDETVVARKQQ